MQLFPTRATFHVALAGASMLALGVALRIPLMVGMGGAMIVAIATGRAFAVASVARLRAAGFEMVWKTKHRITRVSCGNSIVLRAELRNRSDSHVRGLRLRAIASSMLDVTVDPCEIHLPAFSRIGFDVVVKAPRIGRWGLHGIALEVRGVPVGGDALYEVPLMFANPHGIEVVPDALISHTASPRGGRARRHAATGPRSTIRGEGDEFRELRSFVSGDAFKRIAWKASARRGTLLVRETESTEAGRVFCILDGSVEQWAGMVGRAPLDLAVAAVAHVLKRHASRGHEVGLAVISSELTAWVAPKSGPAHMTELTKALLSTSAAHAAHRSEADETELAVRVSEHLRPLDPMGLGDIHRDDLDALELRATSLKHRAPWALGAIESGLSKSATVNPREQSFRDYLAVFGIELPPRYEGEAVKTELTLAALFQRMHTENVAGLVYVFGPAPNVEGPVLGPLRKLLRNRVRVVWTLANHEGLLEITANSNELSSRERSLHDAVRLRVRSNEVRERRALRSLGIHVTKSRSSPYE